MKTKESFIFLALMFFVSVVLADTSEKYKTCLTDAGSEHPKIINCLVAEQERQSALREVLLKENREILQEKIYTALIEESIEWSTYMIKKCTVFLMLTGQRGEILFENCKLEEQVANFLFLKNFIIALDV